MNAITALQELKPSSGIKSVIAATPPGGLAPPVLGGPGTQVIAVSPAIRKEALLLPPSDTKSATLSVQLTFGIQMPGNR
jgi:hypothetical protein